MFNMLNTETKEGKNPPMVCKILDWVSSFPLGFPKFSARLFYLLEEMGFRNCQFPLFGFRIALPIGESASLRIRNGKD
jgi:hypothetical protein